jgi:aminopeptidase-like protein
MEAKGIEIPCPSLSRCPFPEYHTSRDNPGLMSEEHLEEAVRVVVDALMALDRNVTANAHTVGLVCLSNPKYDLYQAYFDPSIPDRRTISAKAARFNKLMNWLPRYFDGRTTALEIAERFELPFSAVRDYLSAWEAKGLVELRSAT